MATVALVHGLGGTGATVQPLADALERLGHHCTVVTLPGHGTAPDDLLGVGWDDWVDAVPDAEVLIGQSMGASLCLAAAARRAGVVAVVAVNALAPDPDAVDGLEWRRTRGQEWLDAPPLERGEVGYERLPMHALLAMANGVLATDHSLVTAPVLLATSAHDEVVDPCSADVVAPLLSGPVVRCVLPNSGHVATLGPDLDLLVGAIDALLGAGPGSPQR